MQLTYTRPKQVELLKTRQSIFKAERQKARQITAKLRPDTAREASTHSCAKHTGRHSHVRTAGHAVPVHTGPGDHAPYPRAVPHTVRRHCHAGADGHGASADRLAELEQQAQAAQKAAAAATEANDRERAQARHREALAEVQVSNAQPGIKADMQHLQRQAIATKLSELEKQRQPGVGVGGRCGGGSLRASAPRCEQQAAQRSMHSKLDDRRRVCAASGVVKVHVGECAQHAPASIRQQQSKQHGPAASRPASVPRPARGYQHTSVDKQQTVWQPVDGLPHPDAASVHAIEASLAGTPSAQAQTSCTAPAAQAGHKPCLPAGFFARAWAQEDRHQTLPDAASQFDSTIDDIAAVRNLATAFGFVLLPHQPVTV